MFKLNILKYAQNHNNQVEHSVIECSTWLFFPLAIAGMSPCQELWLLFHNFIPALAGAFQPSIKTFFFDRGGE